MKFGIARENANGAVRCKAGQDVAKGLVGIWRNRDCRWVGQVEDSGDPPLDGGQQFVEYEAPFVAGESRGIIPTTHLRLEGDVRPLVMAVRREVDAPGGGAAEAGEVGAEIWNCHR